MNEINFILIILTYLLFNTIALLLTTIEGRKSFSKTFETRWDIVLYLYFGIIAYLPLMIIGIIFETLKIGVFYNK